MKKLKYRDWEVYLFEQDFEGIPLFFATAPEIVEVRLSIRSPWEAFQRMTERINEIESAIASVPDDDLPF